MWLPNVRKDQKLCLIGYDTLGITHISGMTALGTRDNDVDIALSHFHLPQCPNPSLCRVAERCELIALNLLPQSQLRREPHRGRRWGCAQILKKGSNGL